MRENYSTRKLNEQWHENYILHLNDLYVQICIKMDFVFLLVTFICMEQAINIIYIFAGGKRQQFYLKIVSDNVMFRT